MHQPLVDAAIAFHGPHLVDVLHEEQVNVQLPSFLAVTNLKGKSPEPPRNVAFEKKLQGFIGRKADMLFEKGELSKKIPIRTEQQMTEQVAALPPLECFMEVSSSQRRERFFQNIKPGDVLVGMVSAIQESGITVRIMCLDHGKTRELEDIQLTAFCNKRDVPSLYAHEAPLDAYNIKDYVRGVVVGVQASKGKLTISMRNSDFSPIDDEDTLGLISEEDLPVHYKNSQGIVGKTYEHCLLKSNAWNNEHSVEILSAAIGLRDLNPPPSLMRGLRSANYPAEEYGDSLRKTQSYRWALKSVAEGIQYFKEGKQTEAMQYLNKALQIDPENVEALVARGALYANNESYSRAIEDFEKALCIKRDHVNATKYMLETLIVHARSLIEEEREDEAVPKLQKALCVDPRNEEAQNLLYKLQNKPQPPPNFQAKSPADSNEIHEAQHALIETADKLRKIMQQDKSDKRSKKRPRNESNSGSESEHENKRQIKPDANENRKQRKRSHSRSFDESAMRELSPGSKQFLEEKQRAAINEIDEKDAKSSPGRNRERVAEKDRMANEYKSEVTSKQVIKSRDKISRDHPKEIDQSEDRRVKTDRRYIESKQYPSSYKDVKSKDDYRSKDASQRFLSETKKSEKQVSRQKPSRDSSSSSSSSSSSGSSSSSSSSESDDEMTTKDTRREKKRSSPSVQKLRLTDTDQSRNLSEITDKSRTKTPYSLDRGDEKMTAKEVGYDRQRGDRNKEDNTYGNERNVSARRRNSSERSPDDRDRSKQVARSHEKRDVAKPLPKRYALDDSLDRRRRSQSGERRTGDRARSRSGSKGRDRYDRRDRRSDQHGERDLRSERENQTERRGRDDRRDDRYDNRDHRDRGDFRKPFVERYNRTHGSTMSTEAHSQDRRDSRRISRDRTETSNRYGDRRKHSESPMRKHRSPIRKRSRSPVRKRSKTPIRKRSRSPVRKRSRSPIRKRSKSPTRKRSKSMSPASSDDDTVRREIKINTKEAVDDLKSLESSPMVIRKTEIPDILVQVYEKDKSKRRLAVHSKWDSPSKNSPTVMHVGEIVQFDDKDGREKSTAGAKLSREICDKRRLQDKQTMMMVPRAVKRRDSPRSRSNGAERLGKDAASRNTRSPSPIDTQAKSVDEKHGELVSSSKDSLHESRSRLDDRSYQERVRSRNKRERNSRSGSRERRHKKEMDKPPPAKRRRSLSSTSSSSSDGSGPTTKSVQIRSRSDNLSHRHQERPLSANRSFGLKNKSYRNRSRSNERVESRQDRPDESRNRESRDTRRKSRDRSQESRDQNRESRNMRRESRDRNRGYHDARQQSRDKNRESGDTQHQSRDRNPESRDTQHQSRDRNPESRDTQHQSRDRNRESGDERRTSRSRDRRQKSRSTERPALSRSFVHHKSTDDEIRRISVDGTQRARSAEQRDINSGRTNKKVPEKKRRSSSSSSDSSSSSSSDDEKEMTKKKNIKTNDKNTASRSNKNSPPQSKVKIENRDALQTPGKVKTPTPAEMEKTKEEKRQEMEKRRLEMQKRKDEVEKQQKEQEELASLEGFLSMLKQKKKSESQDDTDKKKVIPERPKLW